MPPSNDGVECSRAVARRRPRALAPLGDGMRASLSHDGHAATQRSDARRPAAVVCFCLSSPAPVALVAQLCPIVEALFDLALKAALGGIVEFLPSKLFWKIILSGKRLRRIVVVFIARAV